MHTARTLAFAAAFLSLASGLTGCRATTTKRLGLPPLQTVDGVQLERYLGTWYEIASFPQSFQAGCQATTATYSLRTDGNIQVLNRCRKGGLDGKESLAIGEARVVDPSRASQLEVSFFRPFWGDYWIVDLADDYRYAAVGNPGRDYLWILSRTPALDEATYEGILTRLRQQQYDTSRLVRTPQVPVLP